jgi:hypothetical protein
MRDANTWVRGSGTIWKRSISVLIAIIEGEIISGSRGAVTSAMGSGTAYFNSTSVEKRFI